MPEGLKIIVDADVQKAQQALKTFGASLTQTQRQVAAFGGGVMANVNKIPPAFLKIPPAADKATQAINKTAAAVKKSGPNYLEFSRVIQDLPFGFAGIANNLTQLIPGVGALGLAFSALVSAVTFAQVGFGAWTRGLDSAGKSADDLEPKIKSNAERQKELKAEFDAASKAVVSQTTLIEDLGRALVDTTNKIQLLTEATINQGLAQTLFSRKSALVEQALSDAIEKNLKAQQQILKFKESEFKVTQKIAQTQPIRLATPQDLQQGRPANQPLPLRIADVGELKAAGIGLNNIEKGIFDINKLAGFLGLNFSKFVDKAKEGKDPLDDIISRAKELEDFFNKFTARQFDFVIDPRASKEATAANARSFIEKVLNDAVRLQEFKLKTNLDFDFGELKFPKIDKTAEKVAKELRDAVEKAVKANPLIPPSLDLIQRNNARQAETANRLGLRIEGVNAPDSVLSDMEKRTIAAANAIQDVLTPAFQDLFQAIQAGENPLKAFFEGIGQAVVQLIQKLIQAAIQAAILSALFPGGIGGVSGFGGFFKNVLGFASGGIVSGPVMAMIGEGRGTSRSNPEVVAPLDQLRGLLEGIGGTQSVNVIVRSRIRGNDILLSNNRTYRSNRRNGG